MAEGNVTVQEFVKQYAHHDDKTAVQKVTESVSSPDYLLYALVGALVLVVVFFIVALIVRKKRQKKKK